MRVPLVLLTGVDPTAMAATMVGLQFDLPAAVAVRHHIDVERQVLTRTVSDVNGIVEQHEILLEHACVTCAIREDILPTLERVARDSRWQSVVAMLPIGAEPGHLCAALGRDTRLARFLRIASVVTAVATAHPLRDLLGDDLLVERGLHSSDDDRRGVGEVLAAMVEYADVVVLDGDVEPVARGLLGALARPGVVIADGATALDSTRLTVRLHEHARTVEWVSPTRSIPLPGVRSEGVWQVDLRSEAPFHPERLLESLERIGGGNHRSRGCFWLPTRPRDVLAWDGAGGQLSIGSHGTWGEQTPYTRIVVTGVGVAPADLRPAFADLLVRPDELGRGRSVWRTLEDGFEPWLGPIREVA